MTEQQTNNTAPDRAARWRAIGHWLRDTGLGITGFLIVLTVALAGWTASFIGLHQFGTQHMNLTPHQAWLVPITFDGAAAGLSLVVFRASTNGRGAPLWRLLIVAFTALSSWINYVHIGDPSGRWIACYMPPSAVILFEGLMSEARAAAARRNGHERARVHILRWWFDWSGTVALYRSYILGVELPERLQQSVTKADLQSATTTVMERSETTVAAASEALQGSPVERSESATVTPPERFGDGCEAAPVAPRKRSEKRSKTSDRDAAKTAIKALYGALGRRPTEAEMVKELVRIKNRFTSTAFAKKVRTEIEKDNPALAALGTDNVRPLTG